jgi:hypothetical protein
MGFWTRILRQCARLHVILVLEKFIIQTILIALLICSKRTTKQNKITHKGSILDVTFVAKQESYVVYPLKLTVVIGYIMKNLSFISLFSYLRGHCSAKKRYEIGVARVN